MYEREQQMDISSSSQNTIFHKRSGKFNSNRLIIALVVCAILGLVVGLLIGTFAIGGSSDDDDRGEGVFLTGAPERLMLDGDEDVWPMIHDAISASNIEENLRILSRKPHIAGRQEDEDIVKLLKDRWERDGLRVQTTPYDILLSYPSDETPNTVRLLDNGNHVLYDSTDDLSNITNNVDVVAPFLAYSPSGLVVAKPVYVGYGRPEDYNRLEQEGVDVKGKIAIIKFGRLFRGGKVKIAASKGAIGAIIYLDPHDYTGQLMNDSRVYPETWWVPGQAAQRGSVFTGSGDPLTPGYAANNLAYRYTEENVDPPMPPIPCHTIGYASAYQILRHLGGKEAPSEMEWQGGLNLTYRLGPGFIQSNWHLQLNVTSKNTRGSTKNVFGIIPGSIEPDRYVLMGNHRDAWIYGAVDPSSGTAVMMEVARVMGNLVKEGKWKPRRSIMFCSWGAEEYGLIGSTEWVEQYVATLRERGVAYINVDIAVFGNDSLAASGTPVMHSLLYEAAQKVPNPKPSEIQAGRTTVYDSWVKIRPLTDAKGNSRNMPIIYKPGSGSDYAPIIQKAGIDIIDMTYALDPKKYKVPFYAIYHTEYETFEIVKDQFDRHFECHRAMARLAAELVRSLSDSLVIPFNLTTYAEHMEEYRKLLDKDYGTELSQNLTNYGLLQQVIVEFSKDVQDFEKMRGSIDNANPFAIRRVNDQIMQLEKCFLSNEGLPLRSYKKHLIFVENANDAYAASSFPGLVDLLFEIEKSPNPTQRWEEVKKHFSTILQTIQGAGASLRDVNGFMSETL